MSAVAAMRRSQWRRSVQAAAGVAAHAPAEFKSRWAVKSKEVVAMLQIISLLRPAFNISWPDNYSRTTSPVGACPQGPNACVGCKGEEGCRRGAAALSAIPMRLL